MEHHVPVNSRAKLNAAPQALAGQPRPMRCACICKLNNILCAVRTCTYMYMYMYTVHVTMRRGDVTCSKKFNMAHLRRDSRLAAKQDLLCDSVSPISVYF